MAALYRADEFLSGVLGEVPYAVESFGTRAPGVLARLVRGREVVCHCCIASGSEDARPTFAMCSIHGRGELDEDALACFRVEEADHAGDASSGRLVDELDAPLLKRLEFRAYVGCLEADMVQTLALALKEAAHGGVGASGLEELDFALTDCEERGFHSLVLDGVLRVDMEAEGVAIELERVVYRMHGDTDVVDLFDHGSFTRTLIVLKTGRRDSSRLERTSSMLATGVSWQASLGLRGLRMTPFICPLAFAKR